MTTSVDERRNTSCERMHLLECPILLGRLLSSSRSNSISRSTLSKALCMQVCIVLIANRIGFLNFCRSSTKPSSFLLFSSLPLGLHGLPSVLMSFSLSSSIWINLQIRASSSSAPSYSCYEVSNKNYYLYCLFLQIKKGLQIYYYQKTLQGYQFIYKEISKSKQK